MRLAIVTTHPIQYNAPWFSMLALEKDITVHVFYTWEQSQANEKFDPGFNKVISWDIPLLEGYDYSFVKNIAAAPGSHHFKGIDNPTLNTEIESWKPDALLVIGWAYKSHLSCLRYFKGKIPIIFRGDSTLLDETPGIKKIFRRVFLKYIYSKIDYALYVGTNNKEYFKVHGLKESQLYYAPHAIDNDRFQDTDGAYETNAKNKREQLGIAEDNFVVLYAGKLEPKKNVDYILALTSFLKSNMYRFIIVGNGPLESELKQKSSTDSRIIFLDFQNQQSMPVIYRMCNVFILPSLGPGETWGLALNEAMACGKPVIASDKCGGAIDLIHDNGLVINTSDTKVAADFLSEIAINKEMYDKACIASKERIKHFSFTAITKTISDLLTNKISNQN